MATRYEQLRALYPDHQLAQMERIRAALLEDPTALDNRHESVAAEEGTPETC